MRVSNSYGQIRIWIGKFNHGDSYLLTNGLVDNKITSNAMVKKRGKKFEVWSLFKSSGEVAT